MQCLPEDTNADGRAAYLSLDAENEMWADALAAAPGRSPENAAAVKNLFDIAFTSKTLEEIYLR